MRVCVVKISRQRTCLRVAMLVGVFGLQDAGRAGADEHADAPGAVACLGGLDVRGKAVLCQADPRQAVVAAIEVGQVRAQAFRICAFHCTDPGVEVCPWEVAGRQAATLPAQRIEGGVQATSNTTRGGEMREQ